MTREMMMNEEDEKTVLRETPIDDRTRAVARDVDATQLRSVRPEAGGHSRPSDTDPEPTHARLAQVPGAVVDDARYGVRRDPLTVSVRRAESPLETVSSRPRDVDARAARTSRRSSAPMILGVSAFAVMLVIAAIVFVVWITA
jgi:hypothetical protein